MPFWAIKLTSVLFTNTVICWVGVAVPAATALTASCNPSVHAQPEEGRSKKASSHQTSRRIKVANIAIPQ